MDKITEMEAYAHAFNVPIMQKEGIDFMCKFIKEHGIKNILEIGSAIGYSAIRMALIDEGIHITTIERDDERYAMAVANITNMQLQDRILIQHADALEAVVEGTYDMLFIDAAKSQYIRFLERYETNLKVNGYVITDNLEFHGLVERSELATSRNLRQLITKIKRFIEYLKNREDFETVFLQIGDGIGISQKLK